MDATQVVGDNQPLDDGLINSNSAEIESLFDVHLFESQTFGDRALQGQVLSVFVGQIGDARKRWKSLSSGELRELAHLIKGSSGGVGALLLAAKMAALEMDPTNQTLADASFTALGETHTYLQSFLSSR